jgi:RNA polymerase sigma-70 factor (ECF subfamily)
MSAMTEYDHRDEFARLFAGSDRWLYGYLMALLGNAADAEEVFQDVCVVLWREYEVFDLTSDFRKWVSVIAKHRVMQFRASKGRQASQLSDTAIRLIADEAVERFPLLEERRLALHRCLEELSDSDRTLVSVCYSELNRSFKRAAEQLGMSVNTVYKALQRVRKALRACVEHRVGSQG